MVNNIQFHWQIKILDSGLKDWTTLITTWSVVSLLLELAICAVHPFPGDFWVDHTNPGGVTRNVNIDAFLSILMVNRIYLIGKFAVVHSKLLTDTSTNSIGALSKVKINTRFIFKAAMATKPGYLLIMVMIITFVCNTWSMRTCESYFEPHNKENNYIETMWLIAITFLTVGYGDRTPRSYCGRYISIVTGSMGVVTTALLVAILAKNLQQTRSEKYVFSFVSRLQIENRKKAAAANAIKNVFRIHILTKYGEGNEYTKDIRKYHDRLKHCLKEIKAAKEEMWHTADNAVGMLDVAHTVNRIYNMLEQKTSVNDRKWAEKILHMDKRLQRIETTLSGLAETLSKR